jgi:polysaccharide export outer membrane protein
MGSYLFRYGWKITCLFGIFWVAMGVGGFAQNQAEYRLGPDDVLNIQVYGEPDLSQEVSVSDDGTFPYPLIGIVKAEGLTVEEVEKEIKRRLLDGYLKEPNVMVSIKEYKSKKVFILGEVGGYGRGRGPGTYSLKNPTRMAEVISWAGGLSDKAGNEIYVIRPNHAEKKQNPTTLDEAQKQEVIALNMRKMREGDMTQNILLQAGDTIFVPEALYFFVEGEVGRPGRYVYEEGLSVLQAVAMAGGFTQKASKGRVSITRKEKGITIQVPVKMNDLLKPDDIIVVPLSWW